MAILLIPLAATATAAQGQTPERLGDLLLAFALSSIVGLERELRGKSAGLRTQAIVGTASALILLVGKYGFGDVLQQGTVALDPSRVAAQIVSGIGFLGAGLIITRRGAIRGLTTAASVWETAAIGMAAGAGLPLLAVTVTGLHFVVVLGYTPLAHAIATWSHTERDMTVTYLDGRGVLRTLLEACTANAWQVRSISVYGRRDEADSVTGTGRGEPTPAVAVRLALVGRGVEGAPAVLGAVHGVISVERGEDDED